MSKTKSKLLQPVMRNFLVIDETKLPSTGRLVSVEGPVVLKEVVRVGIDSYELKHSKRVTVYALTDGIDFNVSTVIERVETEE